VNEKKQILGIKRDNDYMYFIKGDELLRTKRATGRKKGDEKPPHEVVAKLDIEFDYSTYVYFLDEDGDVACAHRAGKKKQE